MQFVVSYSTEKPQFLPYKENIKGSSLNIEKVKLALTG